MDFLPDDDQCALAEATTDYIRSRFPLSESVPALDDVRWKEITQLGWLGLATDPSVGGSGASLVDEAILFREIGRGLVPGSVLPTVVTARLAFWLNDRTLAEDLTSGGRRVALAVPATGADNTRLLVVDAAAADLALVIQDRDVAVYRLPADLELAPGLEDDTVVARTTVEVLGKPAITTEDRRVLAELRHTISVLNSAQLAGITAATAESITAYAKVRTQFGKPIGAFQAVKHRCADMATRSFAADNIMYFAALSATNHQDKSNFNALAAATYCRHAALSNARDNIQLRGAMGFTVEDTAHRFLKRTHHLCATAVFDRAAQRLGLLPAPTNEDE